MKIGTAIVTGGCGFMGSHLVKALAKQWTEVIVIDAFTYAARPVKFPDNVTVEKCDIRDHWALAQAMDKAAMGPKIVYHLAAESHVCRSIEGPRDFITTNVVGTWHVVEECKKRHWRLIHVSTDEVFGEIKTGSFTESSPYSPRSPYAASKASGDHIVKCYGETYNLDYVIVHPSNNFGPNQHEEKLIPKTILNILSGKPVVIYGKGDHMREWLWVEDFVDGIIALSKAPSGSYCLGGGYECSNLQMVTTIYNRIEELWPSRYQLNLSHTKDRPTDDERYSLKSTKAIRNGFLRKPNLILERLRTTVLWYFEQACASKDGGQG